MTLPEVQREKESMLDAVKKVVARRVTRTAAESTQRSFDQSEFRLHAAAQGFQTMLNCYVNNSTLAHSL
jgi:hypothetical protein